MVKLLVLGSNSFSGQDFIDLALAERDWNVVGVSRREELPNWRLRYRQRGDLEQRYTFVRADMNAEMASLLSLIDSERPQYIVNFSAQSEVAPSWEHPEDWFQTNAVALAKLVNHLRRVTWLRKYVHISSPEAYGNCVGTVTEDTPDNPSTPYAASKAAADMIVSVYHRQYGLPAVTVRATNVYGARQQLFKIMPRTAIAVRTGQRIGLHGGGVAVKSYINVRDVSRGELAVLEEGRIGERYHLSPDCGVAVREVVARIADHYGKCLDDVADIVAERPGQDAAYVIDSTKARTELAWTPRIDFAAGISEVCNWVDENWAQIEKSETEYVHLL